MSISLNFGNSATFTSTNSPSLKAWGIYDVVFEGAEYSVIQGKKDANTSFELLKFNFNSPDGRYTETFFAPKAGDEVRKTRTNNNGHMVEMASNVETLMTTVKHILGTLSPDNLNKLLGKPFKSFKEFAETVIKATTSSNGKEVKIKLVGDKEGKAKSPYCVSVFSNGGEATISNNFICSKEGKLFFSDYETTQMKNMTTSKPTIMPSNTSKPSIIDEEDEDEGELDFDLV